MSLAIPRRQLLRATGAGLVALPFLRPFKHTAHAQAATPKRLIVFWHANGAVQSDFWPTGAGSDFTLNRIMQPLSAHQKDLTILRGIVFSGTGDHKTGKPYSVTGFPNEDSTALTGSGPSIDQEVGAAFGSPPIVVCGEAKDNVRGYISYDMNKNVVVPQKSPVRAYESVFGAISPMPPGGTPAAPGGRDAELDNLILDTALADVAALRTRLPASEQVKMDDQARALAQLKQNLMMGGPGTGSMPQIACSSDNSAAFATEPSDYEARVKLHADLIATAFACDVRRSASLMLSPVGHDNMGGLGKYVANVGGDIHNNIAHPDPGGVRMSDIGVFEAKLLNYLIERLKSIPEGNGTVFDNTVILWTTECTHGNHGHTEIPVVLVGSGGGALRTGQYLQFAQNPGYGNVLLSVMHALGHKIASFGDNGKGPLTELMA
ncbi:MAG: DUF1552 domain-containing protein [Polyangiaceae bacterium]|nr:DUF1552 domain-containing protein [Polyangiaceae bacterium]